MPLSVRRAGRARWLPQLIHAQRGKSFNAKLGACDANGRCAQSANIKAGGENGERSLLNRAISMAIRIDMACKRCDRKKGLVVECKS